MADGHHHEKSKICDMSVPSMHIYKYLLFFVRRDIYDVVEAG